ncbi:hypothetical protein JAAARDRAFT_196488 [Jaapia argillacea MUCL 33604]|uniref:DUF4470 domain-containing protein n=1 Tax=Jaapia argillacea MUCL 33604 TaxID=933084 RepID=A0A067PTG7_9AGAM|nr:hypothetical protein JAAARDRAFT_196488 [Jaapia argillacea MUCL 33604]
MSNANQSPETVDLDGSDSVSARRRLTDWPIFKQCPDPVLEYYTIGHDSVLSLLDGSDQEKVSEISLSNLELDRLADLSFFFGGVGDGRHSFGTIIDIHQAYIKLQAENQDRLRVHMTLMDIHPASIARDLIILHRLDELQGAGPEDETEIRATLFYTYCAFLIPDYCHARLLEAAKVVHTQLSRTPPVLPSWLCVDARSIPQILSVLAYWSKPLGKSTTKLLSLHEYIPAPSKAQSPVLQLLSLPDEEFNLIVNGSSSTRIIPADLQSQRRLLLSMAGLGLGTDRSSLLDREVGQGEVQMDFERRWYGEVVKVFPPPEEFRERHPEFEEMFKDVAKGRGRSSDAIRRKEVILDHISDTWKPNPTIFDEFSTEHPSFTGDGFPPLRSDPFETPDHIAQFLKRFKNLPEPLPGTELGSFHHVTQFFSLVSESLKALKDKLKIELIVGEVTTDLIKITSGDLFGREDGFPRKYTRMWLSNVPDYTNGPLNVAVYTLPSLQYLPEAEVSFNCLLNTAAFSSPDEYCHTYTLLPSKALPRYLGCTLSSSNNLRHRISMKPLPHPISLDKLASRKELTTWLTRLLVCLLVNGNPLPPNRRVNLPNNLAAYFGLLVHLPKVGFPPEWVKVYLEGVLSGTMMTDISPYLGRLPIPLQEMYERKSEIKKLDFDAWLVDLEAIVACSRDALPFSLTLPDNFPRAEDIKLYKATNIRPIDLTRHRLFRYWAPLSSPHVRVLALLFYKPSKEYDAEHLAHTIKFILEADGLPARGDVQIVFSQERVDISTERERGEIWWRMDQRRMERMKRDGWEMAAYRTDLVVAGKSNSVEYDDKKNVVIPFPVVEPVKVADCLEA